MGKNAVLNMAALSNEAPFWVKETIPNPTLAGLAFKIQLLSDFIGDFKYEI